MAAEYWSVRAHVEFDAGRAAEALGATDIALQLARELPQDLIRVCRIYRTRASAGVRLGSRDLAIASANQALSASGGNQYLAARGRFTLLSVLTTVGTGPSDPTRLLTDSHLLVVADRHSPSLGAAGALLRVKARLSLPGAACSEATLDDLAQAGELMRQDTGDRRIQTMQLAETRALVALAFQDLAEAGRALADLRGTTGNVPTLSERVGRIEKSIMGLS